MDLHLRKLERSDPEAYLRALCRIRNPLTSPQPGDVIEVKDFCGPWWTRTCVRVEPDKIYYSYTRDGAPTMTWCSPGNFDYAWNVRVIAHAGIDQAIGRTK